MNRRGFLGGLIGGIVATGIAPAVVRYGSLMKPRVIGAVSPILFEDVGGLSAAAIQYRLSATNFGDLSPLQREAWALEIWKRARELSFLAKFADQTHVWRASEEAPICGMVAVPRGNLAGVRVYTRS